MIMEKKRILLTYSLFVVLLCIITVCVIYRIFYLSVDKGRWAEYGERRLQVIDTIPGERGDIYDCNGNLLSCTLPQYSFYLDFGQLDNYVWKDSHKVLNTEKKSPKKTMHDAFDYYKDSLALCLSNEFGDKTKEQYLKYLQAGIDKKSGYYLVTRKKASFQQMMRVKDFPFFRIGMREIKQDGYPAYKSNLSGLIPVVEVRRVRPHDPLANKMIGDIFPDRESGGKYGLEKTCDSLLCGTPGLGRYLYASVNNAKSGRNEAKALVMTIKEPTHGKDIVSTIDIGMQEIAQKALHKQVLQNNARLGIIALMEVKTGAIRAVASLERNPNGSYSENRNELLLALTEPGSTFKTASMMAALEDNVVHPDDPALSGERGVWYFRSDLEPVKDHNWRRGGYGSLTIPEVIYKSSNIGISKIILKGYRSNPQKYLDRLNAIGVTKPIDIGIEGAKIPIVNKPETKYKRDPASMLSPWSDMTLPWMSFGYEFYLPPVYLLNFYNAIANGGVMMKPMFVQEIVDGETVQKTEPEIVNPEICSPATLSTIQSMLEGVVREGTGMKVKSKYVTIAGKTGTTVKHGTNFTNVSFCGYFPADSPQYTCYVTLMEVSNTSPAGETAGAVFKNVAEQIYVSKMELPASAARDSLLPFFPAVKKGYLRDTEYVLNLLNISFQLDKGKSEWITQTPDKNGIYLNDAVFSKSVVPNVTGMGVKDAVFVLEKVGLKVILSGRGKATQQSLPPGSVVPKGQSITIQLS